LLRLPAWVWRPDDDIVTRDYVTAGRYEVNVGGTIVPATPHARPPYDPSGSRVR